MTDPFPYAARIVWDHTAQVYEAYSENGAEWLGAYDRRSEAVEAVIRHDARAIAAELEG